MYRVVVDYEPVEADNAIVREGIIAFNASILGERDKAFSIHEKGFSIKEFQLLFPETSKRTLQRELKHLLELGLLKAEGSTNDRRYLINL